MPFQKTLSHLQRTEAISLHLFLKGKSLSLLSLQMLLNVFWYQVFCEGVLQCASIVLSVFTPPLLTITCFFWDPFQFVSSLRPY